MKYIIELEDDIKYLIINGKADNRCYTLVRPVTELEVLNSDYINEHYGELQDEAYQKGINDGSLDVKLRVEGAYQKGLEDAWEAARKIVADTDHGGLASGTLCEIFGTRGYSYIMQENTAQEAIDKIKAYDGKHSDRIEVGDEVTFLPNDRRGIVTACHVPDVYAENDKYAVFCGTTVEYVLRPHITKTGKHYDIQSILEAMRE